MSQAVSFWAGALPHVAATDAPCRERWGGGRSCRIAHMALVLAVGGLLTGCTDASVQPRQRDDQGEVVFRSPNGTTSRRLVSATLVQQGGAVAVDLHDATLGPNTIRVLIETPLTSSGLATSVDLGTRPMNDTLDGTVRIKSVVAGIPREMAVLRASTLDTLAVLSTNGSFDGSKYRASTFAVRLLDGSSTTINVTRQLAALDRRRHDAPHYGVAAKANATVAFAAACATRVFNLLAPPLAGAQSTACADATSDYNLSREVRDNVAFVGGMTALGSAAILIPGTIFIISSGGYGAAVAGNTMWGAGVALVGAVSAVYLANKDLDNKAARKSRDCGSGGPRPRPYSTTPRAPGSK